MSSKKRETHVCTLECPYCAKIIEVIQETEVITPMQKADKKVSFKAEKSTKTSLDAYQ